MERTFSLTSDHPFGEERCGHPLALDEVGQRAAVIAETRRWVKTPYRHKGNTLGACCDCANILIEAFAGPGLIQRFDPGEYPPDWHLHRGEERYLAVVERYCRQVDGDERSLVERGPEFRADPGDILMWRWGRTFSHSAIVTDWPTIVHAFAHEKFVVECDIRGTPMSDKPMRVYSFWKR